MGRSGLAAQRVGGGVGAGAVGAGGGPTFRNVIQRTEPGGAGGVRLGYRDGVVESTNGATRTNNVLDIGAVTSTRDSDVSRYQSAIDRSGSQQRADNAISENMGRRLGTTNTHTITVRRSATTSGAVEAVIYSRQPGANPVPPPTRVASAFRQALNEVGG